MPSFPLTLETVEVFAKATTAVGAAAAAAVIVVYTAKRSRAAQVARMRRHLLKKCQRSELNVSSAGRFPAVDARLRAASASRLVPLTSRPPTRRPQLIEAPTGAGVSTMVAMATEGSVGLYVDLRRENVGTGQELLKALADCAGYYSPPQSFLDLGLLRVRAEGAAGRGSRVRSEAVQGLKHLGDAFKAIAEHRGKAIAEHRRPGPPAAAGLDLDLDPPGPGGSVTPSGHPVIVLDNFHSVATVLANPDDPDVELFWKWLEFVGQNQLAHVWLVARSGFNAYCTHSLANMFGRFNSMKVPYVVETADIVADLVAGPGHCGNRSNYGMGVGEARTIAQVAGGGIHQANLHTLWTVLSAVDGSTDPVTRARAVGRIRDALVSERYTRLQNYFRHLSYQATGAELRGPIVDEHAATRAVRFFELLRVLAKSGSVCRNELEATVFAGTTGELMEHEAAGMVMMSDFCPAAEPGTTSQTLSAGDRPALLAIRRMVQDGSLDGVIQSLAAAAAAARLGRAEDRLERRIQLSQAVLQGKASLADDPAFGAERAELVALLAEVRSVRAKHDRVRRDIPWQ